MLEFKVENQQIIRIGKEIAASDQVNFTELCFTFSENWDALDKTIQFTQNDQTYNLHIGTENPCTCVLPSELETGCVAISVFGYGTDNAVRATTVPMRIRVHQSGFVGGGETVIPPTPDLYAQLLQTIVNMTKGASAYEIAVANGYEGTEEEWLASINGSDGLSAYEIAVKNGFDGTEEAWLISLKGEKGDTGESGEDGLSAYEIAVKNGFIGTETAWLESLKGTDGQDGETPDLSAYATIAYVDETLGEIETILASIVEVTA